MFPEYISRYKIRSIIGRGGMSVVYAAHDPSMEREVAIKVLPRELLHDATFKARFELEARSVASLEHPAILPVYDFGEADGQPFLVMRLLTGGSLAQKLKKEGKFTLAEAARVITILADGLDQAHSVGMIHRDLKPANILFDASGSPYIADFGLVKLSEASATLTGNVIVGTPAYMSPEQGRGEKDLDARSDIYSLGVVLFEMLTGQIPYEADTSMAQIIKHISAPIPSILDLEPNLPRDCQVLINRSMSKRREGRFQSAGEMAKAVMAVANGQPIPAPATTPARIGISEFDTVSENPITVSKTNRSTSKNKTKLVKTDDESVRTPRRLNWLSRVFAFLIIVSLILGVSAAVLTYNQGMWNLSMVVSLLNDSKQPGVTYSVVPDETPTLTLTALLSTSTATLTPTPIIPTHTLTPVIISTPTPESVQTLINYYPVRDASMLPEGGDILDATSVQSASKITVRGMPIYYDLEFSPDGSVIAVASSSGVYIFDPKTLHEVNWLPSQNFVTDLDFSYKGDLLAIAERETVEVWDWKKSQKVFTLRENSADFTFVDFSRDDNVLISGDENTYLWDMNTGKWLATFNDVPAKSVSVSNDHQFVVLPLQNTVQLINITDGSLIREFRIFNAIRTAFLPDGEKVLIATDSVVVLYQFATGAKYGEIGGKNLVISGDGMHLTVDNGKGLVQVWRLNEFEMPRFPLRIYEYDSLENTVDFQISKNGGVLAIWTTGDIVYQRKYSPDFIEIYDVIEDAYLGGDNMAIARNASIQNNLPPMFKAEISPGDGKTIVTLRDHIVLEAWDVTTEGPTHQIHRWSEGLNPIYFSLHDYSIPAKETALVSPDQRLRANASDSNVVITREDGSVLHTIPANLANPADMAFSPNSERLATLSAGGSVRIWRLNNGRQVCVAINVGVANRIDDAEKIRFSDDSSMLVVYHTNSDLSYWDAETCQPKVRYSLNQKLISPDGNLFAETRFDQIILRSIADGEIRKIFYGYFREPMGFSDDGLYFAATAIDATVHVWAVIP